MNEKEGLNELQPDKDSNDLNECSRLCAKYFFMNNQEIDMIRSIHKKLICEKDTFEKGISQLLNTRIYQLYQLFFRRKDIALTDWNTFFCFVIVMCFSPTPALFYFLLHINSDSSYDISLEDILSLLTMIHNRSNSENNIIKIFKQYNCNKDGIITFAQFYSLVTKTWSCWENLFKIRKKLIELIFKDKRIYYAIFSRRKHIDEIREYQILHKGKYRPLPCITSIKNLIKSIPHPDKYDYDCFDSEITYNNILFICIKRYKPNFDLHAEPFPVRFLRVICPYEEFNYVDQFYLSYRSKMRSNKEYLLHSSLRVSCSKLSLIDMNNNNINKVEKSPNIPILKINGRYSLVGKDIFISPSESNFNFNHLHHRRDSIETDISYKYRARSKTHSCVVENKEHNERIDELCKEENKSFTNLFDITTTKHPSAI